MSDRFTVDFVVALLHTLWQGGVIAAVTAAFLRRQSSARPGRRYAATLGALAAVVAAGCLTLAILDYRHADRPVAQQPAAPDRSSAVVTPARGTANVHTADSPPGSDLTPAQPAGSRRAWARWGAAAWAVGAGLMLVRAAWLVVDAHGIRRRSRPVPDGSALATLRDEVAARLGLARRIAIAISDEVAVPCVFGIVWPTILVPAAVTTGMSASELSVILAHEMAHVRRWDYPVNLLQLLVEALLFFNPFVWWLSRQARVEREACCDALAVGTGVDRAEYSRVLLRLLEMLVPHAPPTTLAMAGSDGSLLDRVRRLLVPQYRPQLRLPWPRLVGVLAVALLLLAGLWRGTEVAVALAAQVLTPQERLERLAEVEKERTPVVPVAKWDDPTAAATIVGTIRAADGAPLPASIEGTVQYNSPAIGGSSTTSFKSPRFEIQVHPGEVHLQVRPKDYAPALVGPLLLKPRQRLEGVEIVLDRGFDGRLQLTDLAGRPIHARATFEGGTPTGRRGSYSIYSWPTDDHGLLTMPHATTRPYTLAVRAPGFEEAKREDVSFDPDQTLTWSLTPVPPTTGQLLSATGAPVAGAVIKLFAVVNGPQTTEFPAWYGRDLAKTGADGRFRIESLRRGVEYVFLVQTPADGWHLVRDVRAGQADATVTLGPEIAIRGTVKGDPAKLPQLNGKPVIRYTQDVAIGNSSHADSPHDVPVEVVDGQARFTIHNLVPGKTVLMAGDVKVPLGLVEKPMDGVVLDLDATQSVAANRKVILNFTGPEPGVTPRGTVGVQLWSADQTYLGGDNKPIELVDGRAEVLAPVGSRVHYAPLQVIGAWFKADDVTPIPAGSEPLVVDVPTVPAGAIAGRVVNADGAPAGSATFGVHVAEKPPVSDPLLSFDTNRIHADPTTGNFMITPVPLGGTYVLKVNRDQTFVVTQPLRLDASNPTVNVDLKLPKGQDATVRVLLPDGQPVAGIPVAFLYDSPYGGHSFSPPPQTDARGEVHFHSLNPDAPGGYFANIEPRATYCPVRLPLQLGGAAVVTLIPGQSLTGRVVDAKTGRPVPGAAVRAWPADWSKKHVFDTYRAEAPSDAAGRFRFSTLRSETYNMIVEGVGGTSPPPTPAGQSAPVELKIDIPSWSSLRPVPATSQPAP